MSNAAADETVELHKNAVQDVITIDSDGNVEGTVNRLGAYTGDGTRHRVSIYLVFSEEGQIFLAQRAPSKCLWDTSQGGIVTSHPVEGQTQEEATEERPEEELGVSFGQYSNLRITDKFEYKRYYESAGLEREVCAVLKAMLEDTTLDPGEEETADMFWAGYEHLHDNLEWYHQLRLYPWFEIAMCRNFEQVLSRS